MSKKHLKQILILSSFIIILTLLILLITLKIDYYKPLQYQILENKLYVYSEYKLNYVYINLNHNVVKINNLTYINKNLYYVDYKVLSSQNIKPSVYIIEYKLNYLSYIFKVIFKI